ncbi:MAG: dTMP kinase [Candidatus Aenigmarchaeota archaeon]|nr:dTMP kinase [Candidatus Aenigmarchaeota archaeon]
MPGKFVCFEGLDGAGITTQATLVRNYLLANDRDAILTKEPTDGLVGGIIKACLRGEWKCSPLTLQMLYAADRSHHLQTEIEPALKQGNIVISDRYILSSYAYGNVDIQTQILEQLNNRFRKPNLTIIVDTQPRICLERIRKSRHHLELFEEEQKLNVIRKNYLALKNYFPNTHVVDGNRAPDAVFSDVKKIIDKSMRGEI